MQQEGYWNPETVTCPVKVCQAGPEEPCRDRSGKVRKTFHSARCRPPVHVQARFYGVPYDERYYLTVIERGTCEDCDANLAGESSVYRHKEQRRFCQTCADARGVDYLPSRKWMRMMQAGLV